MKVRWGSDKHESWKLLLGEIRKGADQNEVTVDLS